MPRSPLMSEARARRDDRVAAMTDAERVELSMRLGYESLRAYAVAHGLSPTEARRALRALAQQGRQHSRVMRGDD